ncbi:MAG: SDR family NAD(P)-dependent oxidoreductase [Comamonadaceae bacterium]|nr:MAG: SDR family NAD(P)-dependent oxidoreductase [Comamonadaceae bacterium]
MDRVGKGLALISGGSSGIGKECARKLIELGYDVVLLARDPTRLEQAKTTLSKTRQGANILAEPVDVGDWASCDAAVSRLIAAHGPPAWIIACAGMAKPGLFLEQSIADHVAQMQVNYLGTLHLVRAAAPAMARAGEGRIVLVSSGAAFLGIYGLSAYAPSKFAVRGLAEILRLELGSHGVSVTLACPPDTDTPQLAEEQKTRPDFTRRIASVAGVLTAERVASAIVDAGLKRRFLVGPGWAIWALSTFHSVVGPFFRLRQSLMLRHVARKRT